MRRIIGLLLVAIAVTACNKSTDVPITEDEQFQIELAKIDAYLALNHIDAMKHETGIRVVMTKTGTGPSPTHLNCIRFTYEGLQLGDSILFDANTTTGYKTPVTSVVVGMEIAFKMMSVGSKADIYIPSRLGYNTQGVIATTEDGTQYYSVEPNTPIVFRNVELLQIYDYNELGNYCYE